MDDHRLGYETSVSLFKAMGGKGIVVALEGVKGTLTSADRVRGFTDALKEFPNVKLVASQPANYQRLQALQVMENIMQTHQQIDGVFAANDAMRPAWSRRLPPPTARLWSSASTAARRPSI